MRKVTMAGRPARHLRSFHNVRAKKRNKTHRATSGKNGKAEAAEDKFLYQCCGTDGDVRSRGAGGGGGSGELFIWFPRTYRNVRRFAFPCKCVFRRPRLRLDRIRSQIGRRVPQGKESRERKTKGSKWTGKRRPLGFGRVREWPVPKFWVGGERCGGVLIRGFSRNAFWFILITELADVRWSDRRWRRCNKYVRGTQCVPKASSENTFRMIISV